MLGKTIRFSVFVGLFMVGFALAFHALFFKCDADTDLGDSFGTFDHALVVVFGAPLGEFSFQLFDNVESDCPLHPAPERARDAGTFLLVGYLIVMAVVLFNLLIAILSTAHKEVSKAQTMATKTHHCASLGGKNSINSTCLMGYSLFASP